MMRVTVIQPPVTNSAALYEALLGRGNRVYLVSVHGGELVKAVPVRQDGNACAGVVHPQGKRTDNTPMIKRLLGQPYGQYLVTVCYGMIMDVAQVERENALTRENVLDAGVLAEDVLAEDMLAEGAPAEDMLAEGAPAEGAPVGKVKSQSGRTRSPS